MMVKSFRAAKAAYQSRQATGLKFNRVVATRTDGREIAARRRVQDVVAALEAVASPAICRAVYRDPRVWALAQRGDSRYDETLNALVWAPAQPETISATIRAVFGAGGLLDRA